MKNVEEKKLIFPINCLKLISLSLSFHSLALPSNTYFLSYLKFSFDNRRENKKRETIFENCVCNFYHYLHNIINLEALFIGSLGGIFKVNRICRYYFYRLLCISLTRSRYGEQFDKLFTYFSLRERKKLATASWEMRKWRKKNWIPLNMRFFYWCDDAKNGTSKSLGKNSVRSDKERIIIFFARLSQ